MSTSTASRGLLLVIFAAVLWGTAGVTGRALDERTDLSPLGVGFLRLAVGAAVLLTARLVSAGSGALAVPRGAVGRVALVGIGLAAYQACYFIAVERAGVSLATLVTLGLAPVLVALASVVLLGDRLELIVLAALVLALAGLALLVGAPRGGEEALFGAFIAVGSAAGYAGVTLVSRALAPVVDPVRLVTLGFALGAAVLAPIVFATGGLSLPADPVALVLLAYLGLVPSALAYGLFFTGLATVRPTVASIATLVEPLTATLLAALVFGERLGAIGLVGGGLLLGAVVLLGAGGREPRRG